MNMRANALLKHNIDTLLTERGQKRKDLAQWCHRTESWISKIFQTDKREIPLKYLDRIADFFGLATYQLFQPGRSTTTERRRAERRFGSERRIGPQGRSLGALRAEIEAARPRKGESHAPTPSEAAIQALAAEFMRRLRSLLADEPRRQAARTRKTQPAPRPRVRSPRRPTSE